jgi:hypothetical protein
VSFWGVGWEEEGGRGGGGGLPGMHVLLTESAVVSRGAHQRPVGGRIVPGKSSGPRGQDSGFEVQVRSCTSTAPRHHHQTNIRGKVLPPLLSILPLSKVPLWQRPGIQATSWSWWMDPALGWMCAAASCYSFCIQARIQARIQSPASRAGILG